MSRDDSGIFLPGYAKLVIVKKNPVAPIDPAGVGRLLQIANEKGPTFSGHPVGSGRCDEKTHCVVPVDRLWDARSRCSNC